MIHSRHGSVSKRVGALLCAFALILHLGFVPLRVRAFAGVLPAVAAGTVVTAFLMASGIYPYEEQKEFAEYVSNNLSALWSQYLEWRTEQSLDPPVTGGELSSLTGYLTQGVVAVSRNVWNVLSEFTSWIVSHFSVTDNQTGIELGGAGIPLAVPVLSYPISVQSICDGGYSWQWSADGERCYCAVATTAFHAYTAAVYDTSVDKSYAYLYFYAYTLTNIPNTAETRAYYCKPYYNNVSSFEFYRIDNNKYPGLWKAGNTQLGVSVFQNSAPGFTFSSSAEADAYMFDLLSHGASFAGFTADTTTVSALPALPADTPWAGLAVGGTGVAPTVGAVEQAIQEGVTEREKPEVKVVDVEIQTGTDIDTETGEVTENPVVVSPDVVIPAVSELTAPQAFLDALTTTLQTKFPFCLPFDIMRILSAFVKEPQAPLISLSFHDPFSDADYIVSVDLSPWDDVAAIVRQFESMLLLVGFWLNFDKFNVLNIILGQLG